MRIRSLSTYTTLPILSLLLLSLSFSVSAAEDSSNLVADDPSVQDVATLDDDSFVYSSQGRRDPFKPLVQQVAKVKTKGSKRSAAVKGPLEQYELSQYRLVAMMVVKGNPRAMIKDPDGKGYAVKIGEYIGLNDGIVKNIETKVLGIDANGMRIEKNPDRIVIEEIGIDSLTGKEIKENRYIIM